MKIFFLLSQARQMFFSTNTRAKITTNVLWQTGDRFLRLGVGLFIGVWVARYLGPAQFGIFSYAVAYVALFSAFATLGLDKIAAKDIVNDSACALEVLGSSFALRILGGIFLCLLASVSILFIRPSNQIVQVLVLLLSLGTVFQAINVIDFYYVAIVQFKYSIIAKNIAFLLVSLIKTVLLITNRLTLIQLAYLAIIEILLAGIFLTFFYWKSHGSIKKWRVSFFYCKKLLEQSWPLLLSGIAVMLYMRIDQIMLGNMLGDVEVGFFSAAVRISEMWYFLPMIMASSVYPNLIETRKNDTTLYQKRYLTVFRLMNVITFSGALFMTFFSGLIIRVLYGEAFMAAAPVLAIHIWTGVFVFLGVGGSNFYIIEGLQRLHFARTLSGAILSIGLNLWMIPYFGAVGAAMTTLFSQFVVSYLLDAFTKKTRVLFMLKTKSFFPFTGA